MSFKLLVLLSLFCSFHSLRATSLWEKGAGSQFSLSMDTGANNSLWIYVSDSSTKKVGVEMFFSTQNPLGGKPIELWIQSHFRKETPAPRLESSYLLTSAMSAPESVDLLSVRKGEGLGLGDFIFADGKALEDTKIGKEKVSTPAGTVEATHYRMSKDGQTIDYWISESAKPIGLVKLEATGKSRFSMQLKGLVRNVASQIDPSNAKPASAMTRQLLNSTSTLPLVP